MKQLCNIHRQHFGSSIRQLSYNCISLATLFVWLNFNYFMIFKVVHFYSVQWTRYRLVKHTFQYHVQVKTTFYVTGLRAVDTLFINVVIFMILSYLSTGITIMPQQLLVFYCQNCIKMCKNGQKGVKMTQNVIWILKLVRFGLMFHQRSLKVSKLLKLLKLFIIYGIQVSILNNYVKMSKVCRKCHYFMSNCVKISLGSQKLVRFGLMFSLRSLKSVKK